MIDARIDSPNIGDPFGDLTILSKAGERLIIRKTLIDAWLAALSEGLLHLSSGDQAVEIDLVDEPAPLVLRNVGGSVHLTYGGKQVDLGQLAFVRRQLIDDGRLILAELEKGTESPTLLEQIRRTLSQLDDGAH